MVDDALDDVIAALRCPTCQEALRRAANRLTCARGHGFDQARQGYVNLAVGHAPAGSSDTAAMVLARQNFLGRGHYRPIADLIAQQARRYDMPGRAGVVLDLAGGTGYYLAAVLDALPDRSGICLDRSAPALRRGARAHPRAAAIGADAWQRLPLANRSAGTVLSVFGPRDPAEIDRVLAADGTLIVGSPTDRHLAELIEPLGMLSVDPRKQKRQEVAFSRFRQSDEHQLTYRLALNREDVTALVTMGPTAAHVSPGVLASRVRQLPDPVDVTVAVRVSTFAPAPQPTDSRAGPVSSGG